MSEDLLYTPATELARLYRRRQVSPVEATQAALRRIEALQPKVNAYVTVTAEQALADARLAEADFAAGREVPPMRGIPYSVKDLTWTRGVRTTMGSVAFAEFVPPEDAVPVARLKAAGAVMLGKTTTPEFGHKPLTDGPAFGVTRNPWNLERTAGGSSGGAAAAVASGQGPVALGTDGGGSIRIPAACCGLVGLKPTLGRVPHIHAPDLFGNNSYIGPIARTVADCRMVLLTIEGPDRRDPYAMQPLPPEQPLGPSLRLGWMPSAGNRLDPEVKALTEAAVRRLEAAGARVESIEEDFARELWLFHALLMSGMRGRLEKTLAPHGERIDRSLRETIERAKAIDAEELTRAIQGRTEMFRRVERHLARVDFILSPTLSRTALAANHYAFDPVVVDNKLAGMTREAWYPYTWPYNLTGHPAATVPCGLAADGLPVGLQIVGPWHSDHRVLDLAARLEAEPGRPPL